MNNDDIESVTLFRYDLVQPLISESFSDQNKQAYLRRIAATERSLPNGKRGYVQIGTLREWTLKYRKGSGAKLKLSVDQSDCV